MKIEALTVLVFAVVVQQPLRLNQQAVVMMGQVDVKSQKVTVDRQMGTESYPTLRPAFEALGYSDEETELISRIVGEALMSEMGVSWGTTPPTRALRGDRWGLVLTFRDPKSEFSLFSEPVAQDDKACKKLSENCIKCPDGTVRCNVPKPRARRKYE